VVEVADDALRTLDRPAVAAGQRPHRRPAIDEGTDQLAADVPGGSAHEDLALNVAG
jgi:hypothetical protein